MTGHYSPRSVAIVATELSWVLLSVAAALGLDLALRGVAMPPGRFLGQGGTAAALYLAGFYYCDMYNFAELQTTRTLFTAVVGAFSTLALVFGVIFLCTQWFAFSSLTILVHLVVTAGFVLLLRTRIDSFLARHGVLTRVAIVGTGDEATGLAREVLRRHELGHEVSCFVSAHPVPDKIELRTSNPGLRAFPVIAPAALPEWVRRCRIKRVLVATADLGKELPVEALLRCKAEGHEVEDGHTFYERLLGRIFVAHLRPEWLIFSDGFVRSRRAQLVKRVVDALAAGCLLVLTAPLCVLVALAIKLTDGGPVFFGQRRVGSDGRTFTLWKFRSMGVGAEAQTGPQWAEANDPRATTIGRWIRRLRIDEIPQSWNVLRGEMSFVGPRPERPEFVATLRRALPYYDYRHAMRPGISGWAQVNLPYTATVEDAREKLEFDLYYVKNFSVIMDLYILVRTIKLVLFGWGSR